jgi:hypothetical protein
MKKKIIFLLMVTMFTLNIFAQRGWNGNHYYGRPNTFGYGGYGVGWNGGYGNYGNGGIQITSPIGSFSMNFPAPRTYTYTQPCVSPVFVQTVHVHNANCYISEKAYETHTYRITDDEGRFLGYETEKIPVWRSRLICGYY